MADLVFILVIGFFFLASWGLVLLFDRLRGR